MAGALTDRHAIVTGAAQGLGLAIARTLAEAGARVALSDVQEEKVHAAARGLPGPSGRHLAIRADVTSSDQVDTVLAQDPVGGQASEGSTVTITVGVKAKK